MRLEPRLQVGKILLQAADRFRRLLDVVAALVAAADEFHQIVQTHLDRGGVVAAGDLGKRPLDVVLAAVEVGEQLFDRPSFLQHRNEPIAQSLLAGAQFIDARLQVRRSRCGFPEPAPTRSRFGEPLRDRADGAFRIGAGEMMHRRVGVDLRLGQFAHALAHAAEPQLKRVVGAALAQQGVASQSAEGMSASGMRTTRNQASFCANGSERKASNNAAISCGWLTTMSPTASTNRTTQIPTNFAIKIPSPTQQMSSRLVRQERAVAQAQACV